VADVNHVGIGNAREVERKETQFVSDNEGDQFANAQGASEGKGSEWDAAWSDDDDGERELRNSESTTRPSLDHENPSWTAEVLKEDKANEKNEVDDVTDAWGWGDEDEPEDPDATPLVQESVGPALEKKQKEVTLTENYMISSIPEPILKTIISIIEDGTTLTHEQ
jgi:centromere/kinetochore protein ZW10